MACISNVLHVGLRGRSRGRMYKCTFARCENPRPDSSHEREYSWLILAGSADELSPCRRRTRDLHGPHTRTHSIPTQCPLLGSRITSPLNTRPFIKCYFFCYRFQFRINVIIVSIIFIILKTYKGFTKNLNLLGRLCKSSKISKIFFRIFYDLLRALK